MLTEGQGEGKDSHWDCCHSVPPMHCYLAHSRPRMF